MVSSNSASLASPVIHVTVVLQVLAVPGEAPEGMLMYGLYLSFLCRRNGVKGLKL